MIIPVLERLRGEGMTLIGPLPADTLFTPHQLARGDAVLAMYHDQGLPVLILASFGGGVEHRSGADYPHLSPTTARGSRDRPGRSGQPVCRHWTRAGASAHCQVKYHINQ